MPEILEPKQKEKNKTEQPKLHIIKMHNDDYTPIELVVLILQEVFRINGDNAFQLMLHAHKNGSVALGKFTKDIAETRIKQATDISSEMEFPLLLTSEEE